MSQPNGVAVSAKENGDTGQTHQGTDYEQPPVWLCLPRPVNGRVLRVRW
jgi:hypothetical protein